MVYIDNICFCYFTFTFSVYIKRLSGLAFNFSIPRKYEKSLLLKSYSCVIGSHEFFKLPTNPLLYIYESKVILHAGFRGNFRILSNIYGGTFLKK